MFCTKDARPFVPVGRAIWKRHPGATQPPRTPDTSQLNIHFFQKFNLNETSNEGWRLRKSTSSLEEGDEELYYKDNVVIWSRTSSSASHILRSFMVDSPVIEALWCSFIMPTDRNFKHPSDCSNQEATAYLQTCVCVLEENKTSFFCTNGKDYLSALPIPVKRVWPMICGLLFERRTTLNEASSATPEDKNLPVLFSLIHPLDEVVPIISCTPGMPGSVSFVNDPNLEVVYADTSSYFLITFNNLSKQHSVWYLRWATLEDLKQLGGGPAEISLSLASSDISQCGVPFFTRDPRPSRPSLTSLDLSHFPSYNPRTSTPSFSMSRLSTSIPSHVVGYANSPHVIKPGLGYNHFGNCKMAAPPHAIYSPFDCQSPTNNQSVLETSTLIEPCQNLSPEICMELLWVETLPSRESDKATKAFLSEDFGGQKFLCFLIPSTQLLRCVRYSDGGVKSSCTFASTSNLAAKDACPLPSMQMMVVLDGKNALTLYSGVTKMTRIKVPSFNGSPDTTIPDHHPSFNLPTDDLPFLKTTQSDILPPSEARQNIVISLRDPVNNRFNIETSDGNIRRMDMPPLCSSAIVELCLQALRLVLPRDAVVCLLCKWYLLTNTPGSSNNLPEWQLFHSCLLSLLGYKNPLLEQNGLSHNSPDDCKKARLSSEASDKDWHELLAMMDMRQFIKDHSLPSHLFNDIDSRVPPTSLLSQSEEAKTSKLDIKASLYPHAYTIFLALHLCYQNNTLDVSQTSNNKQLASLLHRLSMDMSLPAYTDQYCRDHPELFASCLHTSPLFADLPKPPLLLTTPLCIYSWLRHLISHFRPPTPFPIIPNLTTAIKHVVMIFAYEFSGAMKPAEVDWKDFLSSVTNTSALPHHTHPCQDRYTAIVQLASQNPSLEKNLPLPLKLPLLHSIHRCRSHPPLHWSPSAYSLIGREDLAKQLRLTTEEDEGEEDEEVYGEVGVQKASSRTINAGVKERNELIKQCLDNYHDDEASTKKKEADDGMSNMDTELLKLRFSKDLRMREIRKMLRSSSPVKVAITQRPGTSDHEFIEDQEKYLLSVSIRGIALSIGRGILTMGTYLTVPTEALPIPKLCLSGRVPPRNNLIEMNHIDIPSSILEWPQFHNGVASGLRINNKIQLESSWILFNKLKSDKLTNEHAGFLMGQGLNGQLSSLATLNVHDYLIKGNEMISIGLLLGMAADMRGTMDSVTVRTLSIHVPALLPATSTELDVPHNVQVASVMGIGLLYQATGNRHISEVLLAEIGRPPGPEMENSIDRESYSLAAGFALGNVKLAKGGDGAGVSEKELSDHLFYYMNGSKRKPLSSRYKERLKMGSCQIKEAECVNVDVTGPSAVVALSLIYLKSMNKSVSEWLLAPDTPALLETIKPDLLLLRTVGYGLIMWHDVKPSQQWVFSNVPQIIQECVTEKSSQQQANVDIEHMCQAYVNIVTGACMAIALKYAGTADHAALHCLNHFFLMWQRWQNQASRVDVVGRYTLEQCLCTLLLNIAMVMSGTGDLGVLRKCRFMRSRISPHVSYGNHMAIAMAIGLLVFGGGRYSLCTSPEAIAAMLCAFYPKYPMHSDENRFHLQAFRHLYCLAGEKRILLPREVSSNQACSVLLNVVLKNGTSKKLTAPALLPELNTLSEVHMVGHEYWDVSFKRDLNWNTLKSLLKDQGVLYVKQRLPSHLGSTQHLTGSSYINRFFKTRQLKSTSLKDSYLKDLCTLLPPSDEDVFWSLWHAAMHAFLTLPLQPPPLQVDLHQCLVWGVKKMSEHEGDPSFLRQLRLVLCMHERLVERGRKEGGGEGGDMAEGSSGGKLLETMAHTDGEAVAESGSVVVGGIVVGGGPGEGSKKGIKRRGKEEEKACVLLHEVLMCLRRHADAVVRNIAMKQEFSPTLKTYLKSSSSSSSSSPSQLTALSYFLIWNDIPHPSPLQKIDTKGLVPLHLHLSKHGMPTSLIKTIHKLMSS